MTDVVPQFWAAMQRNEWAAAADFFVEDIEVDWPCSGERIVGRADFVAVQEEYPSTSCSASRPSPDPPRSAPLIPAPRPLAACRCDVLWWARPLNLGRILMRLSRRLARVTAVLAMA